MVRLKRQVPLEVNSAQLLGHWWERTKPSSFENILLMNLREYANAEGGNASTQDADVDGDSPSAESSGASTTTASSAFDAAGNLILPMELNTDHG